MEIIRYTSPFEYDQVLLLIEQTFGKSEAMLELPQMNGAESEFNTDWIYVAMEDGELLGSVHATIPKKNSVYCGVSGVCTAPAARGKGVAKTLFGRMMADIDAAGVRVSVLGTGNMVASKLYSSYGFRYLLCSGVMVRLIGYDIVDFMGKTFSNPGDSLNIVNGSPDLRIPIIPLAMLAGQGMLDCNTNLFGRGFFSQTCCMSLFQRYLTLENNGGQYFGAIGENGMLGAMASILPTEKGVRADVFYAGTFAAAAEQLLKKCEDAGGDVYLQILNTDKGKISIAEELSYHAVEDVMQSNGGWMAPAKIYRKR